MFAVININEKPKVMHNILKYPEIKTGHFLNSINCRRLAFAPKHFLSIQHHRILVPLEGNSTLYESKVALSKRTIDWKPDYCN
jgi:hypothetical protein